MQNISRGRLMWTWLARSKWHRPFVCHRLHPIRGHSQNTKPYYVTTPIFYPNARPHIGHLYSLVLADVYARFTRLSSPTAQVVFVTGTDEHGLKIQKAAEGRRVSPKELCDELSEAFVDLTKVANISNTQFIRTSSEEHRRGVQHLWNELLKRGFIYKSTHSGWYAISDECFYTSAQTEVVIKPRVDEAENEEEVRVASETGSAVEWTEEVNYKFALSRFRERLLEHFTQHPEAIHPPHQRAIILDLLSSDDTLQDLSVSRPSSRISWGVPVPNDPSQTVYVWLDALSSYMTGVGYPWNGNVEELTAIAWPPNLQVIGKDILRFHALHLPAFLLAISPSLPMPQPFPDALLSHAHWTVSRTKMSKSLGNVVDPIKEITEQGEGGADIVRWYLCRVGGDVTGDVDWSQDQLHKHADELRFLLGNLYSRINSPKILRRMPVQYRTVPLDPLILSDRGPPEIEELHGSLNNLADKVKECLGQYELGEAVGSIVTVLRIVNKHLTNTSPWSPSTPLPSVISSLVWARESLRISAIVLQPFIPSKAAELLDALAVDEDARLWSRAEVGAGGQVGEMKAGWVLFPKKL